MTDAAAARLRPGLFKSLELDPRLLGMIGAFLVLSLAFDLVTEGRFLTPRNVFNLTIQTVSVAIMAMGTIKLKPWVVDGEVRPRMVTTVGGSFDHRVVDGDVISRFVADVASVLEEPALLLD